MAGFFSPWLKKIRRFNQGESEAITNYNYDNNDTREHFSLVDDRSINQAIYERVRTQIDKWLRQKKQVSENFFVETGLLKGKRSYLYFQKWGQEGWLLEPSTGGWVISRAVKITHQDRFLRNESCWEAATLLTDEDSRKRMVVYSSSFGEEPMCLAIYEDFLLEALEKSF